MYKQIEIEKVTKEETSKKALAIENIKKGEKFFLNTCAVCHGKKGELEAKGISRIINSLDFEDFKISIRDYANNQKEGVMAMLMAQYANAMDSRDVKNVYEYLKSINSQK